MAECLGTALSLAIVINSGVMAERLADGNLALALLRNTSVRACSVPPSEGREILADVVLTTEVLANDLAPGWAASGVATK